LLHSRGAEKTDLVARAATRATLSHIHGIRNYWASAERSIEKQSVT